VECTAPNNGSGIGIIWYQLGGCLSMSSFMTPSSGLLAFDVVVNIDMVLTFLTHTLAVRN
jgi:hypothetical protein